MNNFPSKVRAVMLPRKEDKVKGRLTDPLMKIPALKKAKTIGSS